MEQYWRHWMVREVNLQLNMNQSFTQPYKIPLILGGWANPALKTALPAVPAR